MLNELERGAKTFFGMTSQILERGLSQDEQPATEVDLREQWQTRLNFVQVNFFKEWTISETSKFKSLRGQLVLLKHFQQIVGII